MILLLLLLLLQSAAAQFGWSPIAAAPVTSNKHDDVFFLNEQLGWLVTRDGKIITTTDGGASWKEKASYSGVRLRAVGFADPLRGWAGKFQVNPSTQNALLRTTNGGETWSDVTNIPAPKPSGICAILADFDPVIYACGRYAGPSVFIKSTDGGATWTSKDLSPFANMLIDIHFFHPDTGIISGAYGNSAAILRTVNGGESWERIFTSSHQDEWSWKISFPTRTDGFVSLQTYGDSVFFLQTTDGGNTWKEKFFLKAGGLYSPQGIGFVSKSVGWIGAYPSFGTNRSEATYKTTDGGATWAIDPSSKNINRFRWLNDTIGFAAGNTVYKYSRTAPTSVRRAELRPAVRLEQNFPNPFNPRTTIRFSVAERSFVSLRVFDLLGREAAVLLQEDELPAGEYSIPFDGAAFSGGVYWYRLETDGRSVSRSMVLIK